jgi:hypothetical protein
MPDGKQLRLDSDHSQQELVFIILFWLIDCMMSNFPEAVSKVRDSLFFFTQDDGDYFLYCSNIFPVDVNPAVK